MPRHLPRAPRHAPASRWLGRLPIGFPTIYVSLIAAIFGVTALASGIAPDSGSEEEGAALATPVAQLALAPAPALPVALRAAEQRVVIGPTAPRWMVGPAALRRSAGPVAPQGLVGPTAPQAMVWPTAKP